MRHPAVFHLVLNELKPWQTDLVERQMIGTAGIANGHGADAEIAKRPQPRLEHGPHGVIALQVAADLTGSVVMIEIAGELGAP